MNSLVLQTDFGLVDGAVSAMHGVAKQVAPNIEIYNLTHDIPQYDIWSGSYRLVQTLEYWPAGTVFVSVVDPGVGSHRKSIAVKTKDGQYIITPDNGTLTHLIHNKEVIEAREIDETKSRLPHSQESHTFHGRDIYAYDGARLASGQITYEEIGHALPVEELETLDILEPSIEEDVLLGNIDILDIRFGSLWTNIPIEFLKRVGIEGDDHLLITIFHRKKRVYQNVVPYVRSFAEVEVGEPLVYINSLTNLGVAINQDSFSQQYNIGIGIDWKIRVQKVPNGLLEYWKK